MCLTEFDESQMTKFSSNTGVPGMLDRSFEKEEVLVEPLAQEEDKDQDSDYEEDDCQS